MHFPYAEMTTPALGGLETSKRPTISIASPSSRQRAHFLILFKRERERERIISVRTRRLIESTFRDRKGSAFSRKT